MNNFLDSVIQFLKKQKRVTYIMEILSLPCKQSHWRSYIDDVSVDWLRQFKGNPLRKSQIELNELVRDIKENGLEEPLMLIVGLKTKKIFIGEGNHRLEVFRLLNQQTIPTRVWIYEHANHSTNGKEYESIFYPHIELPNDPFYYSLSTKPNKIFTKYEIIYPLRN